MIDAALWAEIRRLHLREHLSQREIARQLAIAPRTVRKALQLERFEPVAHVRQKVPHVFKALHFLRDAGCILQNCSHRDSWFVSNDTWPRKYQTECRL